MTEKDEFNINKAIQDIEEKHRDVSTELLKLIARQIDAMACNLCGSGYRRKMQMGALAESHKELEKLTKQ